MPSGAFEGVYREGLWVHVHEPSRPWPLLCRFASWRVPVPGSSCLCGTLWCLRKRASLEAMGFFDPVWPRSPYVENVKVFLRTPQRHFCTQPTHCSLRIRALPGGLWAQPRNKGFGFQGEPAGLRAEEFCGTGITLSCHPLVGKPVVSGVPGLRPEKSCCFKSSGCWLRFLIARLWLTHWFWRTWVSSFL